MDSVSFSDARFDGEVRFQAVEFMEDVGFTDAQFRGEATFDSALFKNDCSFRATGASGSEEPTDTDSTAGAAVSEAAEQDAEVETASDGGIESQPTTARGVFHADTSFDDARIRGRGDFRILKDELETGRGVTESSIAAGIVTVEGEFSAAGARFENVDLSGFAAADEVVMNNADLSEANLRDADLRDAEIEQARLSHANLFGTDLRGAYLHGTVFEGARIDNQSSFGKHVVYHELASAAGDSDMELRLLEKAISLYSQLETLARDNGQSRIARTIFVSRKDAQRRRLRVGETDRSLPLIDRDIAGGSRLGGFLDGVDYAFASLKRGVMRYGESYGRVVGTAILIILVFGALFPLSTLTHTSAGSIAYQGHPVAWMRAFGFGLLYSLSSFTALGVAGFNPGTIAEWLAVIEAAMGIVMFGLLLFVLQRRTVR